MFSILWVLLALPFALGNYLKVGITEDTPGIQWSSGWSMVPGEQSSGGTLISAKGAGAALIYKFTGTAISVYGTEGTNPRDKRANSSYTLDGSTPRVHQESMTTPTPKVLFYDSTTLEDTQHTLVIKNLVNGGGKVLFLVQFKPQVLTLESSAELQLDYFEVTGSAVLGGEQTPAPPPPPGGDEPLQPAVVAGLAVSSALVLVGFILLFVIWRREYVRERTGESETYPKLQLQSQDDGLRVPFLNEYARIEPFTSMSSQPSRATTPAVTIAIPLHPLPPTEQVVVTPTLHRDEKRLLPTGQSYTTESISRLNLGLDVNPRNHSVVGQPSDYESEASAAPRHKNHEDDGGVSVLGSSETINPKVLRLPQDYRRFYP